MTDGQRIELLAKALFAIGVSLERLLDILGPEHETSANLVESVLNLVGKEFPGCEPITRGG